jgi:hypothetical protein
MAGLEFASKIKHSRVNKSVFEGLRL